MKRHGYLFEKVVDKNNLHAAILKASKNKRNRPEVVKVLENIPEHVNILHRMLWTKSYKPCAIKELTVREGSNQKERLVTKIDFFPDQVLHWAIILVIQPLIINSAYTYSCGSMPGRGSHYGKKRVEKWMRRDYKNTKYCAKLDIAKFYPSLSNRYLKGLVRKLIKDQKLLWCIDVIIDTHRNGAPIGYLTSQWFANLALQDLDYLIKQQLHVTYYVRYMDDMVLFGANKKLLHKAVRSIMDHIAKNGLKIKKNWQVFKLAKRALDFMGFRFYHHKTILRKSLMLRITRKARKLNKKIQISHKEAAGMISYMGWIKHTNTYNVYKHHICPYVKLYQLKSVVRKYQKGELKKC